MTNPPDTTAEAPPLRKLNPTPRRAFDIRVAVEGPPGSFITVGGVAQYDVQNSAECGERLLIAGVIPRITTNEPFVLTMESDGTYTGVLYLDRVLDEDYFGRGICHWALVQARVSLVGEADELASEFVAGLPAEVLAVGGTEVTYFWSGHYPRATVANYATFGHRSLDHVPEEKRGEFFSVTMSAREAQP